MVRLLKQVAATAASLLGYPRPVRWLINASPIPHRIHAGAEARISRGCRLAGEIDLATRVHLESEVVLNGDIDIGRWTRLNGKNEVHGDVTIGSFCAIAPRATVRETDHPTSKPSIQGRFYRDLIGTELESVSKGPVRIGNDVWIGERATVLSGVEIGDGAIIGAGSVVTRDVEPYAVVAGAPATRRGWRFDESLREELLELAWWDWSGERIRQQREFFRADLTALESVHDALD